MHAPGDRSVHSPLSALKVGANVDEYLKEKVHRCEKSKAQPKGLAGALGLVAGSAQSCVINVTRRN